MQNDPMCYSTPCSTRKQSSPGLWPTFYKAACIWSWFPGGRKISAVRAPPLRLCCSGSVFLMICLTGLPIFASDILPSPHLEPRKRDTYPPLHTVSSTYSQQRICKSFHRSLISCRSSMHKKRRLLGAGWLRPSLPEHRNWPHVRRFQMSLF